MHEKLYAVYIMASRTGVLYVGVTGRLVARVAEHKSLSVSGFTQHYRCTKLIWFELYGDVRLAIEREKQLKRWHRAWKVNLIRQTNPTMKDLSNEWEFC